MTQVILIAGVRVIREIDTMPPNSVVRSQHNAGTHMHVLTAEEKARREAKKRRHLENVAKRKLANKERAK